MYIKLAKKVNYQYYLSELKNIYIYMYIYCFANFALYGQLRTCEANQLIAFINSKLIVKTFLKKDVLFSQ